MNTNNFYWGLCGWNGIGDFLIKLPAIDYYTLDLESNLYFDITENPKLECLIPKRKNIFILKHDQPINTIKNHHVGNSNHATSFWIPQITKFEGNWSNKEENFIYPYLSIDLRLRDHLLEKLNLKHKKFITLNKISSDTSRNWTEEGWKYLIETLYRLGYSIVNVGSRNSSKNSIEYIGNENTINIDDFNLNLNEVGHIISAGVGGIFLNSGPFHLATTFQAKNIIVIGNLSTPDHPHWMYPNTKRINKDEPIELITDKVLGFLT